MERETTRTEISLSIKTKASELGFAACGICPADDVGQAAARYRAWLDGGLHASLEYLARNLEKRFSPALLSEGARSIICVALNYFPPVTQRPDAPQFAYYAYGRDYHEVMKEKLGQLFEHVKELFPDAVGRCFSDSAPVMEVHHAVRAGIGFAGKNSLLLIPGKGSYFFLGELLVDVELDYDTPFDKQLCGNCRRCVEACPTQAICGGYVDAAKCISYQTIENKSETIAHDVASRLENQVYGCDICQKVCPWNRFSVPHATEAFLPTDEFLALDKEQILEMDEDAFRRIFRHSAVKRAKLKGLKRNAAALK